MEGQLMLIYLTYFMEQVNILVDGLNLKQL
jgi:hypothetical protein